MNNSTKQALPVPVTLGAQGDTLYAFDGANFNVVARVGKLGTVNADSALKNAGFKTLNTDWMNDRKGIATYMATAVNSYPVLRRKVASLESENAQLKAKLKLAEEALSSAGITF